MSLGEWEHNNNKASAVALVSYIAFVRTWHTVTYRPNNPCKWQMPQKLAEIEFVYSREMLLERDKEKERKEKGEIC